MRSIYLNPYKYACVCNIPIDLAKIMCKKQRHYKKEQRKHPPYCPECHSKDLYYDEGSYEEGYGPFVECQNCGETFDCNEIPNIEYANFSAWDDFDPVLYFSTTEDKARGWMEACGAKTQEEWVLFVKENIFGYRYMEKSHNIKESNYESGNGKRNFNRELNRERYES